MATPDVLGAVYDFLQAYITPTPEYIIRGWQNSATLPSDSNDYAVITLLEAPRRGTNVHTWETTDDGITEHIKMLTCYAVQVDFCGTDEAIVGHQAAQLVMLARDAVAVHFFGEQGLSSHYADDPRSLPFTNDQNQWETRYSVTLHLSGWIDTAVNRDAFSSADINLEDVDVHHPTQEA